MAGLTLGLGVAAFQNAHILLLGIGGAFWLAGYFHFAEAIWLPSWGRGRAYLDRIGIAIKDAGFAMVSIAAVLNSLTVSLFLGLSGFIVMLFGKILWELMLAAKPSGN